MNTKTQLRRWRFFSPLLIALLLIGPLVSSAEFSGNFPVTNNGNTLIPANATAALVMQFDLPSPAVDPYVLNGAGYIVADGDALSAFSANNYFGDEDHSNDNGNYSGAEVIVDSANTFIQASEIITPGTADLKANWNVGQNIYFGDEDHDGAANFDGNGVGEIIVDDNLTDGIISGAEVISGGVADLQSFPASYYYLETDGDNIFDDGEDIVKLAHNAAIDTGNGDQIELFGANDYYSDANGNTLYTDGEAIVSSTDANLDNSDTVVTAGVLKNVTSSFCGPVPLGACTYYDPAPVSTPYCVVDDADVSGTITTGDLLVSDTCGTGYGDNHTFLVTDAEVIAVAPLTAIPGTHRFIDDDGDLGHSGIELVWADDGDLILEAAELLFGISSTALTSLSGSLIHVFNDNSSNTFYDDGEEIFTIYYAGSANNIASGDTINAMPATLKFSDNNDDGDYTVTGVTGNTELIALSADLTLSGAEIITSGYVALTNMSINAQMKYSDVNGNSLYNDGELIADSADNILAGGEIVKDGYIDLIDFTSWLMYHDGSGDGNYTDGEDILVDIDNTGYYNADQLTSLKIGNPGTCLDTALGAIDIWEDSDGSDTLTGPDNNLGGVVGVAPYFGTDFATSGSMYTATSNERTIFITIDSAAADGSTVCTVTPIIPNTGGAPYAAQFLSGDDGPTDGDVATADTAIIDLVAPTPNVADMDTYVVEHAGSGTVANAGDDIVLVWDSSSYGDVVSASADFSDFGGGVVAMEDDGAGGNCDDIVAGDDIWCGTYLLAAGTIDDTDNDVTVTLATDAAGNVGADTTDDEQISVDNEAPVVTVGNISVTGDSGTAGAFNASDTPVPTWDNSALGDNNSDIFSVTVDGSAFRAADAAMAAVDDGTFCDGVAGDGIWCATFTGLLDSQDDINNNVSLTVVDDGGNSTTLAGTNDYVVDNELPSFTAVNTVEALMQTGAAPTLSTNLWYYYPGQNLRLQLNNGAETDGNDLAEIKACMRSMNEHSPTQTCAVGDFANPANYLSMSINAGSDSAELNYNLAGLPSGWPTQVDGFQMNFELTDDAGNIWSSAAPNQYYIAVFNVIPQNIVASLNNATTTDWSTITDFTNVPAGTIVFNAQDAGFVDIARMTFNAAMNLTDQATVTGLQALAANVTTTDSVLRLDSSALAVFDISTQLMVKPAAGVQPEFSVKDDTGAVIGTIPSTAGALDSYNFAGHGTASNFVWAAGPGTLTFDVTGFSSYESDVTAPTATITPANSASGVAVGSNVVVTFDEAMNTGTFTYTLSPNPGGLSVVWSGGNTVATISHIAFANSTSYTFSITGGDDLSGNSIAPSASAFTTIAASGGGGGGGGSAAFGAPACSGAACTSTTTDSTADLAQEDGTVTDGTGTTTGYQFTDMTNHWSAPFVEIAKSQGYIEGYEDDTFRPDQEINRAEAAKLIAMWMNPGLYECTESYFTDVSCAEWFGKYVQHLRRMAVIEGYTDGTFRPSAFITRAEALKMMLYAKGMIHPDASGVENIFSDVFSENWFYAPVLKGYSMGIVSGYADGTFGPNKSITRAEFTKMFVNTFLTGEF